MTNGYNPFSLEGKTILVTGASSGIGRVIAIECSKMGANVIITARNEERLQETFNSLSEGTHKSVIADMTNSDDIKSLIESVENIDGLVVCAGIGITSPVKFITSEKVHEVFSVNFIAPIELMRLLLKRKIINKNASIVFIASTAGVYSHPIGNAIYDSSKSAITAYAKSCAIELALQNIRVNTVHPGMIETPFINKGVFTEEDKEKDMKNYLIKRYGSPQEVAYGTIYLLSDASSWTTGSNLVIDGGVTVLR